MNANDISQQIEQWIRLTVLLPGEDNREHCHSVQKTFGIHGGPELDFLSSRHQEPTAPRAPHLFTVSLWRCLDGAVTTQSVRDMSISLLQLRAKYAQVLEDAECRGWHRRHRFSVQGHIIGARFERNTLIDTLSVASGEIVFWTFTVEEGRLIIEPYYVNDVVKQGAGQFAEVFDHLAWDKGESGLREPEAQLLMTPDGK